MRHQHQPAARPQRLSNQTSPPIGPVRCDPERCRRWLGAAPSGRQAPTRAAWLDIDDDFGIARPGALQALENLLGAQPAGFTLPTGLDRVALWRIPDGDVLDQGALITLDLSSARGGLRLASSHLDLDHLAPFDLCGIAAVCASLQHVAEVANQILRSYRTTP